MTENVANPAPEMKVLIATPCQDGFCHAAYTLSLVKTISYFQPAKQIQLLHQFIVHEKLLPRARNQMVAFMLADPTITHLLFIDPRVQWEPEHIRKLLSINKPLVGVAVPKARYLWEKLRNPEIKKLLMEEKLPINEFREKIKANMVEYVINFGFSRELHDGVIEVEQVSGAFMLIQREVLLRMGAAFPERRVTSHAKDLPPEINSNLYNFFEPAVYEGEYLPDDLNFCYLWRRQLYGQVFADLSINLTYHGAEDYHGNILAASTVIKGPL